jgi:hypothetical protein
VSIICGCPAGAAAERPRIGERYPEISVVFKMGLQGRITGQIRESGCFSSNDAGLSNFRFERVAANPSG